MTPFQVVYSAFLAKILDDDWDGWTQEEIEQDMYQILMGALPHFKFPRVSLQFSNEEFEADLSNDEIQLLACYMKCEWLNRNILRWDNIKPLYEERDFSQANLLDKFNDSLAAEEKRAHRLESSYYRSPNNKPFDYSTMAGFGNERN